MRKNSSPIACPEGMVDAFEFVKGMYTRIIMNNRPYKRYLHRNLQRLLFEFSK